MRRPENAWVTCHLAFAFALAFAPVHAADSTRPLPEPAPADFLAARGATAPALERAGSVLGLLRTVRMAVVPSPDDPASGWALGATLARYAASGSGDPVRIESIREFARRTLAGTATARLTPEFTIRRLERGATSALADLGSAEELLRADDHEGRAALEDLRAAALLARFHALRMSAAVHYALFLRAQRLAELVAATYVEKDALQVWRELTAAAGRADAAGARRRPFRLRADWSADLSRLEASVRDLEAQCCPPDPAVIGEKVWRAAADADLAVPQIRPVAAKDGRPESPWRIRFAVTSPDGVAEVALLGRRRGESDYQRLPLRPDADGNYTAEVPPEWRTEKSAPQAFIEALSPSGRGASYPSPDAPEPLLRFPLR